MSYQTHSGMCVIDFLAPRYQYLEREHGNERDDQSHQKPILAKRTRARVDFKLGSG